MKTILLLGAGVTRSARPKAPLSQRAPLDADFFEIAEAVQKSGCGKVLECLRSLVGEYTESLRKSLETSSTYLYIKALDSNSGSPYHLGFLDLLSLLGTVLARTTNTIPVGPRTLVYRFLVSELNRVASPEDLSIITFNYDLLLERTLQSIATHGHPNTFAFPGCYRLDGLSRVEKVNGLKSFDKVGFDHVGVALLKLHGSMSWHSTHTSRQPTNAALMNPKRSLNVVDTPEVSSPLSWKRGGKNVHLKPIIVPPVSGKRGMLQKDVVALWAKAGAALQNAERVVIAGYSCPPLDLESRILISENMRSTSTAKRVYVIDPNPAAAVKFLELCGVDHITIYTSIRDWVRDAKKYPS